MTGSIGAFIRLSAFAAGSPPLSYQWWQAGEAIAGATNNWYDIHDLQPASAGAYTVAISNAYGHATSTSTVTLSSTPISAALDTPGWTWELADDYPFWSVSNNQALRGGSAIQWNRPAVDPRWADSVSFLSSRFSTTLVGPGTLFFKWKHLCFPTGSGSLYFWGPAPENGRTLSTNTDWREETVLLGPRTNHIEWVCFTDTYEVGTQVDWLDNIRFAAGPTAPMITEQPSPTNITVLPKLDVGWSVAAEGTPPLAYQWRRNGTNLTDATGNSLAISAAGRSQQGVYDVVVSNAYGFAASVPINLIVSPVPTNATVQVTG